MSEYQTRLKKKYKDEIVPQLMKDFGFENVMQVPKLDRIVVNMGLGEAVQNAKLIESATEELTAITGRKPIVTRRMTDASMSGSRARRRTTFGSSSTR